MRLFPLALLMLVLAAALPASTAVGADDDFHPDTTAATGYEEASFTMRIDGRTIGRERFVHFTRRDTLFSYSTARFDGLPADSPMPLEQRTTYLQRRVGSYPMYFESVTTERDTSARLSVTCVFGDTTVVVYRERLERGIGEAIALPPGRLYLFEPGVYHPVELLLADFVDGTQKTRRQNVFVPANQTFIDLTLTRGAKVPLPWGGKSVTTTKIGLGDGTTEFTAWVDAKRRLLRLEAIGQGLVIERAAAAAAKKPAEKKSSAPKG